ncbi:flagellar hook-basal body complex protein FliE [endosymbiont of unidentified scaly snail isolate Monju]|uniref:flagellar hook-basal body complex protein FliE n=1 Tax=endosymbiont of unidentified scaly snail isolate Monju TaxID=1248727 RepID=UPI0003891B4C|nr:flagellar hook-basal body complex protein FliE [endosymbiont of unidentified scaly snail isolate Monju]BAN68948.1 flagellar hook-basal body complex protein FliE [endosymbiont of unidentified scaly snail isolate Monju]
MSTPEISQVLAQMRLMAAQAGSPAAKATPAAEDVSFQALLGKSIDKVNDMQQQAEALKTGFETGEPGVDLAQVMIASQKAGLAFAAMTEVRNKLVEAYKDVMNMPL